MSEQQTLSTPAAGPTPYRSIVKDAYSTRDPAENRVEIAAWEVETVEPTEPPEGPEDPIKDEKGNLRYSKILRFALDELGAGEISERTELKSYRDDRGGRAPSTVRGYTQYPDRLAPKSEGGLPAGHPVKRVLRRYARSRDLGHFRDDKSQDRDEGDVPSGPSGPVEPIDMELLKSAYRLARMICSKNGLVFVDRQGDAEAVEDNERIDLDEIRRHDRPVGQTQAAAMVEKQDGYTAEYRINLDTQELERVDGGNLPPGGW